MSFKCAACGGFYNEKCPRWPACQPTAEPDLAADKILQAAASFEASTQALRLALEAFSLDLQAYVNRLKGGR